MTFNIISNGDAGDADIIMQNYRNVNYGNALLPVNSSGVAVDDAINSGSNLFRFSSIFVYNSNIKAVSIDNTDSPFSPGNEGRILADATSGAITIDLPTAVGIPGRSIQIYRIDDTSTVITIDPDGAETIAGESSAFLYAADTYLTVVSDGTNWILVDSNTTKIIDVIDWNMDADTTIEVAHDLADGSLDKVLSVDIPIILKDDGRSQTVFTDLSSGSTRNAGVIRIDNAAANSDVVCQRLIGGKFDSTDFDSTGGFVRCKIELIMDLF